jgi:hypothetical protein
MVRDAQSSAQLIARVPGLAVSRAAWLPWWHPGTVELVFDEPPPAAAQPAERLRRGRCETAALVRKRARMLGPRALDGTGQLHHSWGHAATGPIHPGWKHSGAFTQVGEKRKY